MKAAYLNIEMIRGYKLKLQMYIKYKSKQNNNEENTNIFKNIFLYFKCIIHIVHLYLPEWVIILHMHNLQLDNSNFVFLINIEAIVPKL
jgi:hypothetical protein